jgi:hypothetical protein
VYLGSLPAVRLTRRSDESGGVSTDVISWPPRTRHAGTRSTGRTC